MNSRRGKKIASEAVGHTDSPSRADFLFSSPNDASVRARFWNWLDDKFTKQTNLIKDMIMEVKNSLMSEIDLKFSSLKSEIIKQAKQEIKNEFTKDINDLREKLDQLADSINFMSAKFDEVCKYVAENKKKIAEIEKENKKLKTEIQNLKSSVKILNNNRVKNDCVIRGVKVNEGDKAIDAVIELSKEVGVELEPSAVEDAYFMRSFSNKTGDKKNIVVKFSSKIHKDRLMSSKAKLKGNQKTSDVFVQDFHSKETLNLWNYAKTLRSIGYQHVYVRNGNVFVKKSDLTRQQLIRNEEDVDKMLLDATTNKQWKRRSLVQANEVEVVDTSCDGEDGASYVVPS